jgi:nuclear protein localization protein 4 homolog
VQRDVSTLMAKQVRMERQETPNVTAVSFDRFAAHSFQAYVQSALAFSIKRCGLLYGHVSEDKVVFVDAIYEPDQQGKAERMQFDLKTEQARPT